MNKETKTAIIFSLILILVAIVIWGVIAVASIKGEKRVTSTKIYIVTHYLPNRKTMNYKAKGFYSIGQYGIELTMPNGKKLFLSGCVKIEEK